MLAASYGVKTAPLVPLRPAPFWHRTICSMGRVQRKWALGNDEQHGTVPHSLSKLGRGYGGESNGSLEDCSFLWVGLLFEVGVWTGVGEWFQSLSHFL